MDEITTIARVLFQDEENARSVSVTVVREENGKVSLSTEGFVLIADAKALRKVLA